jgi:hypothetical protein
MLVRHLFLYDIFTDNEETVKDNRNGFDRRSIDKNENRTH